MAHLHEKIDFCAEVFIVHQNKVLLRQHDKYKFWLSVGGHIELDEDPNEAAVREVREEVGLTIQLYCEEGSQPSFPTGNQSLIPPQYMNRHRISDTHQHVSFVYFATSETYELILPEDEKTEGCKWFTKEELMINAEGVREDIQFYALRALEKLSK